MRIINLEPSNFSVAAKEKLLKLGELDEGPMNEENLAAVIHLYDAIIVRLGHVIDRQLLEKATKLKVIVSATTGLNHIDLKAAKSLGIDVLSLQGEKEFLNSISATSEHTMALILSLVRKLPFAHQSVMDGEWTRDSFRGTELKEKTLGVLGFGRLGSKVAQIAHAFGMNVIAFENQKNSTDEKTAPVKFVDNINELAEASDILTIHINSTAENKNFVNQKFLEKMKSSAFLINTARGDVLDQEALLNALSENRIRGAALDVLQEEYEGRREISPLILYAQKNQNLIVTPHIGGATIESMHKTEVFMAHKLTQYFAKKK